MTTVKTPKVFQTITPEATACFIEAITNDKAAKLAALAKATVIMAIAPEWARAEELRALFGVPRNQLMGWAAKGRIVAKKCDAGLAGAAVLFDVASVRRAIGKLPDYRDWIAKRTAASVRGGQDASAKRTECRAGRTMKGGTGR